MKTSLLLIKTVIPTTYGTQDYTRLILLFLPISAQDGLLFPPGYAGFIKEC